MLLWRTASGYDGFEPSTVGRCDVECDTGTHEILSHIRDTIGIREMDSFVSTNPLGVIHPLIRGIPPQHLRNYIIKLSQFFDPHQ